MCSAYAKVIVSFGESQDDNHMAQIQQHTAKLFNHATCKELMKAIPTQ